MAVGVGRTIVGARDRQRASDTPMSLHGKGVLHHGGQRFAADCEVLIMHLSGMDSTEEKVAIRSE